MKDLVSPAVLTGPALNQVLFEAVEAINKLGGKHISMLNHLTPTENPALMLELMDALKIDLFWHEEYNGVEQSVVEADCTLAGPIREASEIDAVAGDVMTAVYRAVIIYAFGNEVDVDDHLLEVSSLGSGIFDGDVGQEGPNNISIKNRRDWMPWDQAASFVGKKVLLRFTDGHIEDATIEVNTDTNEIYYVLFDGDSLTTPVEAFMRCPERDWTLWHECHCFIEERVLLRFQSGHIEDARISDGGNGTLIFQLFDGQIIQDEPVAAMPIPTEEGI